MQRGEEQLRWVTRELLVSYVCITGHLSALSVYLLQNTRRMISVGSISNVSNCVLLQCLLLISFSSPLDLWTSGHQWCHDVLCSAGSTSHSINTWRYKYFITSFFYELNWVIWSFFYSPLFQIKKQSHLAAYLAHIQVSIEMESLCCQWRKKE